MLLILPSSDSAEGDSMFELADIFSDPLTTAIFVYGSLAFLAACAIALVGTTLLSIESPARLALNPVS